jgi:hypothetical protein
MIAAATELHRLTPRYKVDYKLSNVFGARAVSHGEGDDWAIPTSTGG